MSPDNLIMGDISWYWSFLFWNKTTEEFLYIIYIPFRQSKDLFIISNKSTETAQVNKRSFN